MRIALGLGLLIAGILVAHGAGSKPVSAQSPEGPINGFIVGVQADADGALSRFAVSDSGGSVYEFTVSDSTEFGLENEVGDRWVSTYGESPVEAADRLRNHQQRLAPITVSAENGVATSVVERESGKLETNLAYLFAVFAVTWAGFFAYMFWVSRKQRELQKEIARLRMTLDRASGGQH